MGRRVVAKITFHDQAEHSLRVVWFLNDYHFSPYFVSYQNLKDAASRIRAALTDLVAQRKKAGGLSECGHILKRLAQAGHDLYQDLFFLGRGSTLSYDILQKIKQELKKDDLKKNGGSYVTFHVAPRINIPWGLLYDADPTRLPGNPSDVSLERYSDFWCVKFFQATVCVPTEEGFDGETFAFFNPLQAHKIQVLQSVHRGVFERAKEGLSEAHTKALAWLDGKFGKEIVAYTKSDLFKKWGEIGERVGVLYFYCHANPSSLALSEFKEDEISVPEFRRNLVRRRVAGSTCLVFLNGCETVSGNVAGGFFEATRDAGYTGCIGPETKIPDVFALRFGLTFLYLYLRTGKNICEVMDRLRVKYWPLSLIYGNYCAPDMRISVSESDNEPELPLLEEDLSQVALGTEDL